MEFMDSLDPEFRALVHEYGFEVVGSIYNLGVTDAEDIRNILERERGRNRV
jgi:hypothetical protein